MKSFKLWEITYKKNKFYNEKSQSYEMIQLKL